MKKDKGVLRYNTMKTDETIILNFQPSKNGCFGLICTQRTVVKKDSLKTFKKEAEKRSHTISSIGCTELTPFFAQESH